MKWNWMMAATLIGFTGLALRAEPPEVAPLPPQWDALFTLNSGAGFKDNVFLSHAAPQDYANQTVSASDTSRRQRTDATFDVRPERCLGQRLTLVASYEYEQTLSNDALETYAVNTVMGTLQWEF